MTWAKLAVAIKLEIVAHMPIQAYGIGVRSRQIFTFLESALAQWSNTLAIQLSISLVDCVLSEVKN